MYIHVSALRWCGRTGGRTVYHCLVYILSVEEHLPKKQYFIQIREGDAPPVSPPGTLPVFRLSESNVASEDFTTHILEAIKLRKPDGKEMLRQIRPNLGISK